MSLRIPSLTGRLVSPKGDATAHFRLWVSLMSDVVRALVASGTTANRPTTLLWVGRPYFDTTLGYPVWYSGSGWVDSSGSSV